MKNLKTQKRVSFECFSHSLSLHISQSKCPPVSYPAWIKSHKALINHDYETIHCIVQSIHCTLNIINSLLVLLSY